MDWYYDPARSEPGVVRRELVDYLRRHADARSDLHGAELAVGELIANVVEHAPGPMWLSLDWSSASPRLEVHDLGPGLEFPPSPAADPYAESGRGFLLVSHLTEELELASKRAGGARVAVTLPVTRALVELRHDPPVRSPYALPAPDEALADGTFGRESFLRALAVELAKTVELEAGPDVAERFIAHVGAQVGNRMETEYRRARELGDALTPEQIADLYVRLKASIGGDFFVVSADDEKIVLGNRRCPFGAAVQRSPGLCRMTSSVFGGIAARNTGGSEVQLEERIAVGDPECRVTVWLNRRDGDEAPPFSHSYRRGGST